jgi:hypothetical protein
MIPFKIMPGSLLKLLATKHPLVAKEVLPVLKAQAPAEAEAAAE